MSQKLKVERKGHVLCIGLNRPEKYNAMDVELYLALADAYGELQRGDQLRCGLLYGEGQHFCAGLELDKWGRNSPTAASPNCAQARAIPSA
jgi:enoyl-CoA hydratase/carnithine racemase